MVGHPEASISKEKSHNQICGTHLVKQISDYRYTKEQMSESFNHLRMPYPIGNIYITRLIRIGDKNSPSESVGHIRRTQLVK